MKKIKLSLLIFFVFISFNIFSQNAKEIFLENLTVFESLQKDENAAVNLNQLYEAREFLITVTGISYEMEKSFEMPIFPPDKTLKSWRNWYDKNKEKLFWNKESKKVEVLKD